MHYNDWLPEFKSIYKDELKNFILFKRSNGYEYSENTIYEFLRLDKFFIMLDQDKIEITEEIVDKWIEYTKPNKNTTKQRRISNILNLSKFLIMKGYENVIIPSEQIFTKETFIPYIFTDDEINTLYSLLIAKVNKDSSNINHKTFYILFSLYYGCGLRKSEALDLTINDFNINERTLSIIKSKNNVSRYISLSDSIYNQLLKYIKFRNSIAKTNKLFINQEGQKYSEFLLYKTFHGLLLDANIKTSHNGKRPRLHDLRHTFAVNSLKVMQDKGFDLYVSLPLLSTYLGHKSIVETEYYLRLVLDEARKSVNKCINYTQQIYQDKELYNGEE